MVNPPNARHGAGAPLDAATARRLSVEASCDPKTIRKALLGLPIRGDAGRRAREALARAGLLVVEPTTP
jgi:hypothetical protein